VRRNLIQKGLSFRPELSDGQRRPPLRLFEQNLDVLNRRDEAILNLLAPQPPPATALEVMIVGRIRKAALGQMFSAPPVPVRGRTVCLLPCAVKQSLVFVPFDRAPVQGPRVGPMLFDHKPVGVTSRQATLGLARGGCAR
jgi:hypothetical protein